MSIGQGGQAGQGDQCVMYSFGPGGQGGQGGQGDQGVRYSFGLGGQGGQGGQDGQSCPGGQRGQH